MRFHSVVVNKVENGFILEINRVDPTTQKGERTIEVYITREEVFNRVNELI